MKKLVVLLVFFSQLGHACDCNDLKWVQKASLKSNKLILLHFSNQFSYESDDFSGTSTINPIQLTDAVKPLMQDFLYVCANSRFNAWAIDKYQINRFPQLLIVDGNGQVVYRFANSDDGQEFSAVLLNFSFSTKFFKGEQQQFRDNPSYNTALRLAQKYLDFSLIVDATFKNSVYAISKGYLTTAEGLLTAKDERYAEKKQKLELFRLFHWAYEKNFALLDQELSAINTDQLLDGNANLFYFLKYVTAKGLQQDDFSQIQAKAQSIEGFDVFEKKANIILSTRA